MRSTWKVLVAAAAALLVAPQLAMADEVEEQLRQMNERMGQLESQLQATQDQLDSSQAQVARQQDVMEKAGLERQAQSGLSAFYNMVEISGWVAASYFWNFNSPSEETLGNQNQSQVAGYGVNTGINSAVAPFHPDHNSFSVDQLWFELEKPVTEESRAGFRADLAWGKTAGLLGAGLQRLCGQGFFEDFDEEDCLGDSASDFNLYQAYVQYLTPWGPTIKAGKMATWVGAEVVPTVYNFNVTRGLVWTLLQPVTYYGVTADGQTDGGLIYGLGVLNSGSGVDPDFNNAKTVVAKVGYAGETFSAQTTLLWGPEGFGHSDDEQLLVDLLLNFDPTENFSAWINFDYATDLNSEQVTTRGNAYGWGIAAAGRYAFTDRVGFALRAEFAQDSNNYFGFFNSAGTPAGGPTDVDIYGFTGTIDWTITDNLVAKFEARYDRADYEPNGFGPTQEFVNNVNDCGTLYDDDCFTRRDQVLAGVELTYQF